MDANEAKYTELELVADSHTNTFTSLPRQDYDSDSDEIDITSIRRNRTANDLKQWVFVTKKMPRKHSILEEDSQLNTPVTENHPLLRISATDMVQDFHQMQTYEALEIDLKYADLHTFKIDFSLEHPSPVPNVDFLYAGISEKRMRFWCNSLQYQLLLQPETTVEWLLMIDNQLAVATHNHSRESRKFNLSCWRNIYIPYYRDHVSKDIFKFYYKYGLNNDDEQNDEFRSAKDDVVKSHDENSGSIFKEMDRIRMLKYAFQTMSTSADNNTSANGICVTDEIEKRIKDKNNVLLDAYACHEYDILSDMYLQIWSTVTCKYLPSLFQFPLQPIRDYFGEAIAFNFLFMISLTKYLLPVASIGTFFQTYQWTSETVEVELLGLFACLLLLWTIVIPLLWEQKESKYAQNWGQFQTVDDQSSTCVNTIDIMHEQMERIDFEGKYRMSTIDGSVSKFYADFDRICNNIKSWLIMMVILLLLITINWTFVICEYYLYTVSFSYKLLLIYGLAIVNGIFIVCMDKCSYLWLKKLNDMQNHNKNIEYDNSYFLKHLIFNFVNYFSSLYLVFLVIPNLEFRGYGDEYYIVDWLNCSDSTCMSDLQFQFGCLYITIIVFNLFWELWHFTFGKFSFRRMRKFIPSTAYFRSYTDMDLNEQSTMSEFELRQQPSRKPDSTANEYLLYDYHLEVERPLSEFLVQFGFISGFSLYFPWSALIAVLYNLFIIRLEMHKLMVYCRRPYPSGKCSVLRWTKTMKVMAFISILVISFIFTVDASHLRIIQSSLLFPHLIDFAFLLLICGAVFVFGRWLFPRISTKVQTSIDRQKFIAKSIADNYSAMREYQESLTMQSIFHLQKWTIDEVYEYFNNYGYPRYQLFAKIVLKYKINGEKLCLMSRRDLLNFGINDPYHRIWIEEEIESLQQLNRNIRRIYESRNYESTVNEDEENGQVFNRGIVIENTDTIRQMRRKQNERKKEMNGNRQKVRFDDGYEEDDDGDMGGDIDVESSDDPVIQYEFENEQ